MDKAQIFLDTARRVIRTEAEGLTQLSDGLGKEFAQAVELMLGARGRIIVSGMGKSGHIARKILLGRFRYESGFETHRY